MTDASNIVPGSVVGSVDTSLTMLWASIGDETLTFCRLTFVNSTADFRYLEDIVAGVIEDGIRVLFVRWSRQECPENIDLTELTKRSEGKSAINC